MAKKTHTVIFAKNYLSIKKDSNYMKVIAEAFRDGMFKTGEVAEITIQHDDWCAIFKGGKCNCDPDIIQHVKEK